MAIINPDNDQPITDPQMVALIEILSEMTESEFYGIEDAGPMALAKRIKVASRLVPAVRAVGPRGGEEYGLIAEVKLKKKHLAALGPIAQAVDEAGGSWSFQNGTVYIRMNQPHILGAAPRGTHDFGRGWIMARGCAAVDDALEAVGLPRLAWQGIEHNRGKVIRRYQGIVRS